MGLWIGGSFAVMVPWLFYPFIQIFYLAGWAQYSWFFVGEGGVGCGCRWQLEITEIVVDCKATLCFVIVIMLGNVKHCYG